MKIKSFLLLLFCLSLLAGCKEDVTVVKNDRPVELILTKEEQDAMNKWKRNNVSYEILVKDALINRDKAALYMVGMGYLTGLPSEVFTINIKEADYFFALSASLGFGPALDQIRRKYFDDDKNTFLSLVYLNLTITAGHQEFVMAYHNVRNEWVEKHGPSVYTEIERIAANKNKIILKNKRNFAGVTNFNEKNIHHHEVINITDEDLNFNSNYWSEAVASRLKCKELESKGWNIKFIETEAFNPIQLVKITLFDQLSQIPTLTKEIISKSQVEEYIEKIMLPIIIRTEKGQEPTSVDIKRVQVPMLLKKAIEDFVKEAAGKSSNSEKEISSNSQINELIKNFKTELVT